MTTAMMRCIRNPSIDHSREWKDGDLVFTEVIRQEYSNCCFSAGFVDGHPVDTLYLQAEKDGAITTQILLRPDEMAAIAWLSSGVLWSVMMKLGDENDSCGTVPVCVRISEDMSHTGRARWAPKEIDSCIADVVEVLVQAGIYTSGCCCGHGQVPGNIILTDGRTIKVSFPDNWKTHGG